MLLLLGLGHSIRSVSTANFQRIGQSPKFLRQQLGDRTVFSSFCFKDIHYVFENCHCWIHIGVVFSLVWRYLGLGS